MQHLRRRCDYPDCLDGRGAADTDLQVLWRDCSAWWRKSHPNAPRR